MAAVSALAALAGALVPTSAPAGAWVQRQNSYYFKVSASYLSSTREFTSGGDKVEILSGDTLLVNPSYRDVSVSLYLEYGLTDRFTAVASLPFKVVRSTRTELSAAPGVMRDVVAETGGFADASLGVRAALAVAPVPVSVEAAVKLPLGYERVPDNGGPPLGSSRVDMEGRLLAGLSLYPFPGYVTGGVGYRVRTGDLSDDFVFSAQGGASWRRASMRVGIDGTYSTTDPPDLSRAGSNGVSSTVRVTNQDILKLMPGLEVALDDEISLVAEAFHVLSGKNTVAGTTWSVGVVYRQ